MNIHKIPVNIHQTFTVLMLALLLINTQISVVHAAQVPLCAEQPTPALTLPEIFKASPSAPDIAESATASVQDVLLNVCEVRGYGKDCAKTLLGIMWNESSNRSAVIGDRGKARGYFQIHYKLHNISTDCAEDLVCSANWTLDYLERNKYPKYVSYAIQCHNGCNANNGYAAKAVRNGNNLWDDPLEVNQAAPVKLSMIEPDMDQAIQ